MSKGRSSNLRVDPVKALKKRVEAIRKSLPINYKDIIYKNYPEYATEDGRNLIMLVVNLRSACEKLTGILEAIHRRELTLDSKVVLVD